MLQGCGGGGASPPQATPSNVATGAEPVVTDISTNSLRFGLTSTFVGTGSNLDESVVAKIGGITCSNPQVNRTSASEVRVTCTPEDLGIVQIELVRQGVTLKTRAFEVVKPRVRMVIGTSENRRQVDITVDPGQKGGLQRSWANNFLHYVNNGFYDGTIFHRLYESTALDGGCYARDPSATPSIAAKRSATVFSPAPVQPLVIEGALRNLQYTFSLSKEPCVGSQLSGFALNLLDNSTGKITDRDKAGYVAIGSYNGNEAAIQQQLVSLSKLAQRGQVAPPSDWLPLAPADLAAGTIQSFSRVE